MYISIDIGGTKTRVASSKNLTEILLEQKFYTLQDWDEEKKALHASIKYVSQDEKIEYLCIGVPGIIDRKNNKLGKIINIPELSNLAYRQIIPGDLISEDKIIAENDATLAGLGEAVFGPGKDFEVVVYITLSTGVGGVRIVNKKIDPFQKFSEPGHMIIKEGGRLFEKCQQNGCFSAYSSGTAFKEMYQMSPKDCTDQKIWDEYAYNLSIGLLNVTAMWSPDIIILGGSITNKFDEFFKDPLLKNLNEQKLFDIPLIVKSSFGDESGLYGGFVLIKDFGKL